MIYGAYDSNLQLEDDYKHLHLGPLSISPNFLHNPVYTSSPVKSTLLGLLAKGLCMCYYQII